MGLVARRVADPRLSHCKEAKKILCYLAGTKDHMVIYAREGELTLVGHSDADFAKANKRSIARVILVLGKKKSSIGWGCSSRE